VGVAAVVSPELKVSAHALSDVCGVAVGELRVIEARGDEAKAEGAGVAEASLRELFGGGQRVKPGGEALPLEPGAEVIIAEGEGGEGGALSPPGLAGASGEVGGEGGAWGVGEEGCGL
jgi:hypothetical protein